MSVELLVVNLLRIATEDLDGARLLAASGSRNAVYLCEQAAEKVIRNAPIHRQRRLDRFADVAGEIAVALPTLRQNGRN